MYNKNVSVILTVYNEEKGILRVLEYLEGQHQHFEDLVIISDNCVDNTNSIIDSWIRHKKPFQVLFITRNKRLGRADAIRLALKTTKHNLTVILAGDILPLNDSLANLIAYFNDPNIGAVTGHPILLNQERTIADCLSLIMWKSHNQVGYLTTLKKTFFHLNGEMFAIRKHIIQDKAQWLNYNSIAEDAFIGYLIQKSGYQVVWSPKVKYYMTYPSSIREWLQIRKRCCYGRIELSRIAKLKDYPYYELTHSEYVINVLTQAWRDPRKLFSLFVGVPLEILCRVYYSLVPVNKKQVLEKLWNPASETKW